MSKTENYIAYTVQIVLGVLFIFASSGKVFSYPEVIAAFTNWGYPDRFYIVIGIFELVCGVMLFYPKTAGYGAIMLIFVMIGAVATHIIHDEGIAVAKPLLHMALLVVVFYFRFYLSMKEDDKEVFPLGNME